ncbi:VasL domain-containing protein, partial [Escherichia coli]|uniref:VasL domain-containing protein n=1 Tax=Escherichia coli TaxID=562 RepID=UPI00255AC44A
QLNIGIRPICLVFNCPTFWGQYKEGLTLSYIKNVIWQAERGLGQETPVESLLTQYHDARAQKQNTDALEKQINERLEGVLSRWLLLKNNVMPEAATGTTAEK